MLSIIVTTMCCVLLCSAPCSTQHTQMCDVDRWVADNDMPINKLELSSTSNSKLMKSLRSEDKLIKCSELRLIHKEAELDRPFKQNRYKISSKRARGGRNDDRHREHDAHYRDGERSDHRREDRRSSEMRHKDKLDALDGTDDHLARSIEPDDDVRDGSRKGDKEEVAQSYNSESRTENLHSNLPDDKVEKQPSDVDQQNEIQQEPVDPSSVPPQEQQDHELQKQQEQEKQPVASNESDSDSTVNSTATTKNATATLENSTSTLDNSTSTLDNTTSTLENTTSTLKNATATLENATLENTSTPTSEKQASGETADTTADSREPGLEKAAELKIEESVNQTSGIGLHNATANVTASNRTKSINWVQHCLTSPRANNQTLHVSWKFCRIFYSNASGIPAQRIESRPALSPSVLCNRSFTEYRNKSIHLCEVFFQRICFSKTNNTKPSDQSINNGTQQLPTDTIETPVPSNRSEVAANDFVMSCLQCPAVVSSSRGVSPCQNKTRSMCVFAQVSDKSSPASDMKQQLLVDNLQFIDDTPTKTAATATASAVAADSATSADVQVPSGGGELEETELPTRVRQKAARQPEEGSNDTNASAHQQGRLSNDSAKPVVSSDPEAVAKQIESLSHSAFMTKLFDALMSKRRATAGGADANANWTLKLDNMNNRIDHLANITSQKSNKSELDELKSKVYSLEATLKNALALLEQGNRKLKQQVRKFEVINLGKIATCQTQLNKTRAELEIMATRHRVHNSQVAILTRRIIRMSRHMRQAERNFKRAVLQPTVPPMHKPISDDLRHHQHPTYTGMHIVSAEVPNVNGKFLIDDCSDVYGRNRKADQVEVSDGIYPTSLGLSAPVDVRCDMKNNGWTYILSRSDGKTDFFRNWTSYRTGFGDPKGEHFIGLDALAEMTARRRYKLWVLLEDWEGTVKSANYNHFQVSGQMHNFQLHVDQFHGDNTVGDSLSSHSNASFSTFDFDNDLVQKKFGGNCAKRFRGGFWYFSCYRANPTGQYYPGGKIPNKKCDGIVWKTWKGPHYSLKSIHMKIKPH